MSKILTYIYNGYSLLENNRDRRIEHYFLMGHPIKLATVLIAYAYFVKKLGPKIMKNRNAYNVTKLMMAYNILQVIINSVLAILVLIKILGRINEIQCLSVDRSYTKAGYLEAQLSYAYYMLKVFDLMDTIFFVVRKKFKQASFLHMYHHIMICTTSYVFCRYAPGGHGALLGLLNTIVHALMYFYYLLVLMRPANSTSTIWWKRHLTLAQLLQFTILAYHFGRPLFRTDCKYPIWGLYFGLAQSIFMFGLFTDFYINAYIKKSTKTN